MRPSLNDIELIARIKEADRSAFDALVSRYRVKVINTCYRFFLNKEDAEDISQDVFVEIHQSISSFRGDAKLSTWIYRIAVTKCLDEIKKRNRKKRITSIGKLLKLEDIAGWITGGESADRPLLLDEKMQQVMQVLDTLPTNQRAAFTLSKLDSYRNAEIAEIMNTTIIALESLVSRAKRKVGTELENILKK